MIIAELFGKIPSKLENKEDVLTSNVFSFFKYSDRQLLQEYLAKLGIPVSLTDSRNAEFLFWQSFDDGTEPDLVIVCGEYYILFEAKFHSDFAPKTTTCEAQIDREIRMGKLQAENANKKFVYVALTAEYYQNKLKYVKYKNDSFSFVWTNWQTITSFIEEKLLEDGIKRDKDFALDIYSLLIKKKLRSFKGIGYIENEGISERTDIIFYSIKSSQFKGEFSGFIEALEGCMKIKPYQSFYDKAFFKTSIVFKGNSNEKIFYYGRESQ